jgi:flagellar motility protein MotE (MotC chaperone)
MKTIVGLGVLAIVLFTAAAGLSTWLTMQKAANNETDQANKKKAREKDPAEPDAPIVRPTPIAGAEAAEKAVRDANLTYAKARELELRVAAREKQFEAVLADFRAERDAVERTRRQLADELKLIAAKNSEVEKKLADLDDQRKQLARGTAEFNRNTTQIRQDEQANLAKMATMFDAMSPENAAKLLQEMAGSGKIDTAVKLLANMKQTKSSKVLSEMSDPTVVGDLIERMKRLQPAPPAAGPAGQ